MSCMPQESYTVTVILTKHQRKYMAYAEELPEISVFGGSLPEARENIMYEITKHAFSKRMDYTVKKIKYRISLVQ